MSPATAGLHEASGPLWVAAGACLALTFAATWWASLRLSRKPRVTRPGPASASRSRTRTIAVAVLTVAAGWGVTLLLGWGLGVLTKAPAVEGWDRSAAAWVADHRPPALNHAVSVLTAMGGYLATTIAAGVIGLAFSLWERRASPLFIAAAAVAGAYLLRRFLGIMVAGSRPPSGLAVGTPAAYPSGGTIRVLVVLALAAWLLSRHRPTGLPAWWAVAATLTSVEGLTRVWLNRHWAVDVVGGVAVGALWALTLIAAGRAVLTRPVRPGRIRSSRTGRSKAAAGD